MDKADIDKEYVSINNNQRPLQKHMKGWPMDGLIWTIDPTLLKAADTIGREARTPESISVS
jgi:hypothetical protein